SDFHGDNKPQIQLGTGKGNLKIPYSVLKRLREN
ncbi:MAG: PHP domain-containing protein, partial [Blautia sp.]|nr:PHP domain-containing protein [Blautia sp.]